MMTITLTRLTLLGIAILQLAVFAFVCCQRGISTDMLFLWFVLDVSLLVAIFRVLNLEKRQESLRRLIGFIDSTPKPSSVAECAGIVTKIKKRLDEMRMRETLLFDYSQNVLLMLDEEGKVIAANKTVAKSWGVPPQNILGERLDAFISKESIPQFNNLMHGARSNRETGTALLRIESPIAARVFAQFSLEWSETRKAFYCSSTDYSAQWMVEKVRAEYSGMLTHDLRTPLASLKLLLESLQSDQLGVLTDAGTARVSTAMSSLMHLSSLVSKLVTLDQSEAGELRFHQQMVPLDSIVSECVAITKPKADKKQIRIEYDTTDDVVWCDKEAITRVCTNLLANAVEYSKDQSEIQLSVNKKMQEIQICIADRGPGVKDERKQSIFERYKTGDTVQGLGLGLAVAKALISAHGQKIGVLDRDGGGSIFYFTLRLATEEEVG